jgi:hypothetical protein
MTDLNEGQAGPCACGLAWMVDGGWTGGWDVAWSVLLCPCRHWLHIDKQLPREPIKPGTFGRSRKGKRQPPHSGPVSYSMPPGPSTGAVNH